MKSFKLNAEMELRFEVAKNEEALLKLTQGPNEHAEIFGTELASERVYAFPPGSKVAVWTWHGCHLQLEDCKEVYPHKWDDNVEIPMHKYANLHLQLEEMRNAAKRTHGRGPRVMVCGPQNSGKSSLCRLLMNYAARQDRCFLYADLDPVQNDIVPGCVAAVAVVQPISIEDKFSLLAPLGYFVGETDCTANAEVYGRMVSNLAKDVLQRALTPGNDELKYGGVVVNTSGLVAEKNVDLLVRAIKDFDVDVVYIMDDEKLTAALHSRFKPQGGLSSVMTNPNGTALHLEKVVKSGGVVTRSQEVRKQEIGWLIKEYFYGSRCQIGGMVLNPHRSTVSFDAVQVVRIGGHRVQSYLLPAGAKSQVDPCQPVKVDPTEQLQHRLAGLSFARTEDELISSNVLGLVWIQSVDVAQRRLTLLLPSPAPSADQLPGRFIVVGNMVWLDS
eukprot:GGOE01000592.1.p1 GENE.GGOE01000592.1~~GGOE01000592.1.p1  ORF type:complete len:444 (-),score=126.50 GGOE01000592.1:233-1564(-)